MGRRKKKWLRDYWQSGGGSKWTGRVIGRQRAQREEGEAKRGCWKLPLLVWHEESGSQQHSYIYHRAEVGQNYLDFSGLMGFSFSRFWVVVEGDGVQEGPGATAWLRHWPPEETGSLEPSDPLAWVNPGTLSPLNVWIPKTSLLPRHLQELWKLVNNTCFQELLWIFLKYF